LIKIQIVSKYIKLSEEGLVPKLECPIDQGLLFCNEDLEENVYLYCLSCSYKTNMGLEIYDKIDKKVKEAING